MIFENGFREVSFGLRSRLLGRAKLRPGLPDVQPRSLRRRDALDRERSFYTLILTRAFEASDPIFPQSVWDVGCRNWSYARALADFFPTARRLIGVEIDGWRRHWNLHRRMDYALAFSRELNAEGDHLRSVRCIFEDFAKLRLEPATPGEGRELFCFFYPFVSADPCLSWGLPARYALFPRLLRHALNESRNIGKTAEFLSVHQGEWELEIALRAYADSGLRVTSSGVLKPAEFSGLWPSPHDCHWIRAR